MNRANNIIENSESKYVRSFALYEFARNRYWNDPFSAKIYLEKYLKEYPHSNRIKQVNGLLNSLNLVPGEVAPNFIVETLEGQTIQLNDFKGKFVFLMFGTIDCPHCKEELPNLNALYQNIPNSQMEIIEIYEYPRYPKEKYFSYTEKNNIKYLVTLGNEKTDVDYGISFMPLMFLIGPDNRIISTNMFDNMRLRGKELVDEVSREIEKYN